MARGNRIWRLAAAFAALFAVFCASLAHAGTGQGHSYRPVCHVSTAETTPAADVARSANWRCDGEGWSNAAPKVWLRFDRESWQGATPPAEFYSHITRISGVTVATVDETNRVDAREFLPSQLGFAERGPFFSIPLPQVTAQTRRIIVGIARPHNVTVLTKGRVTDRIDSAGWTLAQILLVAVVLGILLTPVCFDVAFYTVLREKFVLLHLAMALTTVVYILLASNLVSLFVALPLDIIAIGTPMSWALVTSMSVFFITAFLEPGALPPRTRRALHFAGLATLVIPGFFALQIDATQSFDNTGYFLSLGCLIAVICFATWQALARGSRSAIFLAAAWAPVIAASSDRLLRGLGFYVGPPYVDQFLYAALGLEVILIALGVTDRFVTMRRQRDRAVSDARMMEELADRDALTGLLNRRAIEPRFANLREQGFDTVAVIDLDLFKGINDRFGHQTGDAVLTACAAALQMEGSRDTIAVRLGGEEFMLLVRGKNPLRRAEAIRQAITARIARDVEGLDRPITASMGVIEIPRMGFDTISFAELYSRADMLLYEAKAAGRNRTMSEKMQSFGKHPPREQAVA